MLLPNFLNQRALWYPINEIELLNFRKILPSTKSFAVTISVVVKSNHDRCSICGSMSPHQLSWAFLHSRHFMILASVYNANYRVMDADIARMRAKRYFSCSNEFEGWAGLVEKSSLWVCMIRNPQWPLTHTSAVPFAGHTASRRAAPWSHFCKFKKGSGPRGAWILGHMAIQF